MRKEVRVVHPAIDARLKFSRLVREKEFSCEEFEELKARVRSNNAPWKVLGPDFPRHLGEVLVTTLKAYLELYKDFSLEEFMNYIKV